MKRLLISAVLAAGLLASSAVHAGERSVTFAVENMTCAACPYIVKKAMASVPGVTEVDVSYAKKTAVITFDDAKTSVEAVARASVNAGYPAKLARQNR